MMSNTSKFLIRKQRDKKATGNLDSSLASELSWFLFITDIDDADE